MGSDRAGKGVVAPAGAERGVASAGAGDADTA